MATFGELRTEVLRNAKQSVNGDLVVDANLAINDAIAWYAPRALEFNEGFSTIATVDGVPDYPFPDDMLMITHAQLFWGGQNFTTLVKRNWQWYLDINQDASNLRSVPSTYYAVHRKRIFLYPTPSVSTARIDLYYTIKIDPLVADDDTNVFTENARLLIRSRALYDLYSNRLQQADQAKVSKGFEQWEYTRLTEISSANLGDEQLEPFRF
ncbi:hypothetical protein N9980_01290 [bacterium]|nr:hypothetical protein [bacterium]